MPADVRLLVGLHTDILPDMNLLGEVHTDMDLPGGPMITTQDVIGGEITFTMKAPRDT
jgi:hypothetical protein